MLPKKHQKGFIDPISLFAIGFLVVSLIVGTKIATDKQRSLDIREEAKMTADCAKDSECGTGYKCIGGYCEKIPTPSTPKPTTKPVTEEDKLTAKEEFLDPGTPAPAVSCTANGKCLGLGEKCCGGKNYFDNKCSITDTRCGTKPASSSTSTCVKEGNNCNSINKCCSSLICTSSGICLTSEPEPEPDISKPETSLETKLEPEPNPQPEPDISKPETPYKTTVNTVCSPPISECVAPYRSKTCNTDGNSWTYANCKTGTTCNYSTGKCEAAVTSETKAEEIPLSRDETLKEEVPVVTKKTCRAGLKEFSQNDTVIGTLRSNGNNVWICKNGTFIPCDTCKYEDLTLMPQYIKQFLQKDKPCTSSSGLSIQSGETAYGSYSSEKGSSTVYECNNGKWILRDDLTKPSIKPLWDTGNTPSSESSCYTQTSIVPAGGATGTLTDIQICLNGELTKAECNPGVAICSSPTISEICSDVGQWQGKTCLRGCDNETGKCAAEDTSVVKTGDKENGKRCSGLSDNSCRGVCSPTPYGWYCLSAEIVSSSPHQLGGLKCDGNFLKEFQNGAWMIVKNCSAGGCQQTDQGLYCVTQNELEEVLKKQEENQNRELASCQWQCDKRYINKGICILKTNASGEINAECLEIPSVVQEESLIDAHTTTYSGFQTQDVEILACGGSGERCCTKQEVGAGERTCNLGLGCNEKLNRCVISSAEQIAAIIVNEIASSNKISVEEISNLIALNTFDDLETQEGIVNYLKENIKSLCNAPCNGTCAYSDKEQKYTCLANNVIDNRFIDEYEGGEYGLERSDKKGDLGNTCRNPLFGKKTCNDPWLTCNSSDICELNSSAKTLTANVFLENSSTASFLNTQLIADGEKILELALNRELAGTGCVNNDTYFMKNGICWRCNNAFTKSMSQAPSVDFCQSSTLANLYPGTQCKKIGGYCANDTYANKQDVTSHGISDCYSGTLCLSKNEKGPNLGLNEKCDVVANSADNTITAPCSSGLICHKEVCQDNITLAYDDDYAGGRLATSIEEALPFLKFIVSPVIRSFTPSYYNSTEVRAQIGLSMIENIGENEETIFDEAPELENVGLGSLILESLDEAAKANATVARAQESPSSANEYAYIAGSKIWSFVSTYTGEPPLSRGGGSGTNAFYEYASKQSDINQALANEEITSGQANGMRIVSAVKPAFQAAFVVADTLPVLKTVGSAINAVGIRNSSVVLSKTGLAIAAPAVGSERLASGITGLVGKTKVVQKISSSALVQSTKATMARPLAYSLNGIRSMVDNLARIGIGSQDRIIKELTETAARELAEEALEKGTALAADDVIERALQIAKSRGRSVTEEMIITQINKDLIEIIPSMKIADDLFEIIGDDISEIVGITSKNSNDVAIELAEKVAKAKNISFEEALGQTKRVTEALELADKWGVNLTEVGGRENYVQIYDTLLERVSTNEGAALSEAETRLLFGSLGEESTDKIVKGLIFDKSPLVAPKTQSLLQNVGLADESGKLKWPWEKETEEMITETTADEFFERTFMTAESWGKTAASENLRNARGHLNTHGENILKDIETYLPELPPEYLALPTTLEKIEYIQRNFDNLFTDETLAKIGRYRFDNTVLSEISYTASNFLNLDAPLYGTLQGVVEKVPEIDSIKLVLFNNGQEIVTVTRGIDKTVLRIKDIAVSPTQASLNLSLLPEYIPKTEMQIIDGRAVLFIENIDIAHNALEDPELIALYARRLTEETGFIPDIHGANFVIDVNGNMFYVDQDIFDYALTNPHLIPDEAAITQTEEAIAKYYSQSGFKPSGPTLVERIGQAGETIGQNIQQATKNFSEYIDDNFISHLPWQKQTGEVIEETIESRVVSRVDEVLSITLSDGTRAPGCRNQACGFSSELVVALAESNGLKADMYQVIDLNAARGVASIDSFQHAITIITTPSNDRYLVDLTFSQFMNTETGLIQEGISRSTGIAIDHPLAQELLEKGYVKLDEDVLDTYLRLTSLGEFELTNMEILEKVLPLPPDISPDEILRYLPETQTKPNFFNRYIQNEDGTWFPIFKNTQTIVGVAEEVVERKTILQRIGFADEDGAFSLPWKKDVEKTVVEEGIPALGKKPISPDEAKKVYARLNEPMSTSLELTTGVELPIKFGFDPDTSLNLDGLTYFLEPNQQLPDNVKIIDITGQVVDMKSISYPLPFNNIERVVIDGKSFELGRDAWLNPTLYHNLTKDAVINPKFIETIPDIIEMWHVAATSPDELKKLLKLKLDPSLYDEITKTVEYLKMYPEIQRIRSTINPWDVAKLSPEERLVIYKKEFPSSFSGLVYGEPTPGFLKFQEIVEIISNKTKLSSDDIAFLNAWTNKDIATFQSASGKFFSFGDLFVDDYTEHLAVAALTQNALVKDLIPPKVYSEQTAIFNQFAQILENNGVEVPNWFGGYRGNEFTFGIKIDSTKANAAGQYFLSSATEDSMVEILIHERIHNLSTISNEVFTETMALLIANGGDIEAALAANTLSTIRYKTGVEEFLYILKEINTHASDDLAGTKLMFQSLTERFSEELEEKEIFKYIQKYYDDFLSENASTFAERMSPYENAKLYRYYAEANVEESLSTTNMERILQNIDYETVPKNSFYTEEDFTRRITFFTENPKYLLSSASDSDLFIREKILSDPKAKNELAQIINTQLNEYADSITNIYKDILPSVLTEVSLPNKIRSFFGIEAIDNIKPSQPKFIDQIKTFFNKIFSNNTSVQIYPSLYT